MWLAKLVVVVLALLLFSAGALHADKSFVPPRLTGDVLYEPGQLIVQFKPGLIPSSIEMLRGLKLALGLPSVDALMQKYRVGAMRKVFAGSVPPEESSKFLDLSGFYVLYFPASVSIEQIMAEFGFDEDMILAEPVYLYTYRAVPNDPSLALEYWLPNTTHGMHAYDAWDVNTGDSSIIMAVIDSGVNYTHPDLKLSIWVNPGEDLDGDRVLMDPDDMNGFDDDGDTLIDDFIGWDFVFTGVGGCFTGEDCSTPDNDPNDFNGHGTFIAGLVAAVTNNAQGIAGIGGGYQPYQPGVRIMALRAGNTGSNGLGYVSVDAAAAATNYARIKGADVINYSWGVSASEPCDEMRGFSATLWTAITNALSAGIYVTHAAGNDDLDCAEWKDLISGVVTVAALNSGDYKAWFSNYGDWVDISAAGVGIYSTDSPVYVPGYSTGDGTSFSAPIVAACAALLKSQQPSLTRVDLDTLINNHAIDLDTLNPTFAGKLGVGRPNLAASMQALPNAQFNGGYVSGPKPLSVTFTDASPNSPSSWFWDFGDGQTSTVQNPPLHNYDSIGIFTVSLTVTEPRGTDTRTKWNSILVSSDTFAVGEVFTAPVSAIDVDTVEVPIYLTNLFPLSEIQAPITWKGAHTDIRLLSTVVIAGTRCATFEQATMANISNSLDIATFRLRADMGGGSPPLPPGSGMICKLLFELTGPLSSGEKACVRDSSYNPSFPQKLVRGYFTFAAKEFYDSCLNVGFPYLCGDANNNGFVNIADVVYLLAYIFSGGPAPIPLEAGDANCNGITNIADVVYLIAYIFNSGPAPCAEC